MRRIRFPKRKRALALWLFAVLTVTAAAVTLWAHHRLRPPVNQPDRFAAFTALHDSLQAEGEDAWSIYAHFFQGRGTRCGMNRRA